MFETSPSTEKIDAALAKAQAEIQEAELNCKNPFYNSEYADLTSVWRACRKALTSNGISVTQWPVHSDDGRLYLVTRVACEGEWMRSSWSAPVAKQDPQGYGSATTYLKRFALCAAVGVVGDSDDDSNGATTGRNDKQPPAKPPQPPKNHAPSTKTHLKQISALATDRGIGAEVLGTFVKYCYPGMNSQNMTRTQAEEIVALLEDKATNEGTLMAAVSRVKNEGQSQAPPQ